MADRTNSVSSMLTNERKPRPTKSEEGIEAITRRLHAERDRSWWRRRIANPGYTARQREAWLAGI